MNQQEQRIHTILGDDCERNRKNANRYRIYLKRHLSFPIRVTGIEDFSWEEPYLFGVWDKKEYERMKKTNPSYTDEFDLLDILKPEHDDLMAKVRRLSDKKVFRIELSWLKCIDKNSPEYFTLHDYSCWYVNY